MVKRIPRVVLAARSQQERKRRRAGIRLRDFSIAPATKARYESAVGRLLPFLELQADLSNLDFILCDYIELQWTRGESLHFIADALSGLHFYWPELKGALRNAWRMFKCWRRIEAPHRAPPITPLLIRALIARAVKLEHIAFAALLAVGFHALLRTGELLNIQNCHFEISAECGILTLPETKTGQRTGSKEAVALRDSLTLQLLHTWRVMHSPSPGQKIWPYSAQRFREQFYRYLRYFRLAHLEFKPYSLRRGGATYLMQQGVPLDTILLRGRWHSLAVARLYLQDGMALLPSLRIPPTDLPRVMEYAGETPSTAFRPY